MLMEPFLLLFSVLGIFCLVRFRQFRDRPFSLPWCGWLAAGFLCLGAATRWVAIVVRGSGQIWRG